MAEELGPKFGHAQDGGMTYLNRKIVDRFKNAQDIISNTGNTCSEADVHDLRIIVRETISYMTAVLVQNLIDSMIIGESTFVLKVDGLLHRSKFIFVTYFQSLILLKRNNK